MSWRIWIYFIVSCLSHAKHSMTLSMDIGNIRIILAEFIPCGFMIPSHQISSHAGS